MKPKLKQRFFIVHEEYVTDTGTLEDALENAKETVEDQQEVYYVCEIHKVVRPARSPVIVEDP